MRSLLASALLLLIALSLPQSAAAQTEDAAIFIDQLIRIVPPLVEQEGVPGAALALIHNHEVVWTQGYGITDLDDGVPVTPDTPFNVASISKALTAWEIMRLVEAGKLDLDAPVNQYLKTWQLTGLGRNDPNEATIRRILSHTAGLSVDGYPGFTADEALPSLEEFLDGEGGEAVKMIFPAGVRFSYSGGGYTILQLMIEELTGKPFAQAMRDDVLEPLGMDRSSFVWSAELGAATGYRSGQVEPHVVHMDQAAGGLYTTANDLARFFSDGMSADWLTPENIALTQTPAEATRGEYGFGYFVIPLPDGSSAVWHDGIGAGMRSVFLLLPERGEGLILLTNSRSGSSIFRPIICEWDRWVNGTETKLCQSY